MSSLELSERTKSAADQLLSNSHILETLSNFGFPQMIGSYYLDVMLRKELDINLSVTDTNDIDVAKLISEIYTSLKPISFDYRNRSLPETRIRIDGHWLKLKTLDGWNLDIWVIHKEEAMEQLKQIDTLKGRITNEHRNTIITLKSLIEEDKELRKTYFGARLYDSVLNHNVESLGEYRNYLESIGDYDGSVIDF